MFNLYLSKNCYLAHWIRMKFASIKELLIRSHLIVLTLLMPLVALSQVTISGSVINQADTKPVSNASVFLSNATIGDHTAADGSFKLSKVKPGQYNLVISIVGFDTYSQTVIINKDDIDLQTITIYPKTIGLKQVTIKPETDFERQRNYDWFKEEFLGKTDLAKDCKILNPEVLDLNYDDRAGILTASSADFLVIQNNALGFKIKYLLKDFTLNNADELDKSVSYSGAVLFEFLKGRPNDEQQWQKQRQEVYNGSVAHFLRSALGGKLDKEGFRILRLPANPERPADELIEEKIKTFQGVKHDPNARDSLAYWMKKSRLPKRLETLLFRQLKKEEFIEGPDKQGFYSLSNINDTIGNINDALFVSYNKDHRFARRTTNKLSDPENKENTLLIFDKANVLFDRNGNINDPKSLTYEGVWSRNRMAGMLPLDYESGEKNTAAADSALINIIEAKLNRYTAVHPAEKVYLHFDKPYYGAGDTIYFKAYVTSAGQHQLSALSGILHADLINQAGKLTKSIQLQLNNGLAWGDFTLPDTLKGGNYHIRAYTNLMRNNGEDSFYEQEIPIGSMGIKRVPEGGNLVAKTKAIRSISNRNDIQFLPEGGSLIANNYSRIAFKAVTPNGFGTDVKGTVTDDTGQEVCTFASAHLGMGAFHIVAREGVTYKANLTYADGTTTTVELPKAVSTGYTLSLNNSNADTIGLRITAAGGRITDKLTLLAQAGGVIYYAAESATGVKFFSAAIPKNKFPTGIVQFTLFGAKGEPLNERLAFINNAVNSLKLTIAAKDTYAPRQKVDIKLNTTGAGNNPATGSFSVAVVDETNVPVNENAENTILSNLLLTSELRGAVEEPNYYFRNVTNEKLADLDVLMLTQGYRSFEWKKVLTGTASPAKYQAERSLQISGTVKRNGKPVPEAKVKLFTTTNGMFMLDTLTDGNGKFIFPNLEFADNTKFVVQSRVAKGQDDVTLSLDTPSFPAIAIKNGGVNDSRTFKNADTAIYMINQRRFYEEQLKYGINKTSIVLKEVKIEAKKDAIIPHSDNLNGSGNADVVITAKELEKIPCVRIVDCLGGLIPFVGFGRDGTAINKRYGGEMAILIDGNYVDPDVFADLSADDIEGIEVIMGAHYGVIYGSRMANGGILVTTKRAKKINNYYRYSPGVVTYMPKGFYKAREFYSPQYDNPHTNQKMADLRSTIYWNPNIITDKDGKASFSYFNADGKGTYRVVIEGIDADGNLGRQVLRYKVE